MDNIELHKEIKSKLTQYYVELVYFNPVDTEFNYFNALGMRKFLETHKSSMNDSELLMLTVVDQMVIEAYKSSKNITIDSFHTSEALLQEENFIDLKKAVLIARKNLKDNPFIDSATKVQKLREVELIFNSCVVETCK